MTLPPEHPAGLKEAREALADLLALINNLVLHHGVRLYPAGEERVEAAQSALSKLDSALREDEKVGPTDHQQHAEESRLTAAGFDLGDDLDRPYIHCDCAKCRAYYATPPQPSAQEGWRPIETAPKDGRRFLACVDGVVRTVAWGKTSHVPLYGFCLADQGVEDCDLCEPTHWMPLPPPPGSASPSAPAAAMPGRVALSEEQIDAALHAFDTDRWDFNLTEDGNRRKAMKAAIEAAHAHPAAPAEGEKA